MNLRKLAQQADYSDITTIGIPRALLYYYDGAFITAFFEALGCTVVLSEPTTKETFERGNSFSNDEVCLASKIYMGHVYELLDKCDGIFVPSMNNYDRFRAFCPKCQALPDLVRNTFADQNIRVVSCLVEKQEEGVTKKDAYEALAMSFGRSKQEAKQAYEAAMQAEQQAEAKLVEEQNRTLAELAQARQQAKENDTDKQAADKAPLGILMAAHPYITHDPFTGGVVVDILKNMGVTVLFADSVDLDHALATGDGFSKTLPWVINREIVGAIYDLYDQVDGVLLVSAFPCGPDSMANDAIMRRVKDKPILNIMIDSQSGTAGLETRIESFIDILRYQKKGGYIHVA